MYSHPPTTQPPGRTRCNFPGVMYSVFPFCFFPTFKSIFFQVVCTYSLVQSKYQFILGARYDASCPERPLLPGTTCHFWSLIFGQDEFPYKSTCIERPPPLRDQRPTVCGRQFNSVLFEGPLFIITTDTATATVSLLQLNFHGYNLSSFSYNVMLTVVIEQCQNVRLHILCVQKS